MGLRAAWKTSHGIPCLPGKSNSSGVAEEGAVAATRGVCCGGAHHLFELVHGLFLSEYLPLHISDSLGCDTQKLAEEAVMRVLVRRAPSYNRPICFLRLAA